MSSVRKHNKIPPAQSPSLPGYAIDANVCRNPACDNFGLSEADIQPAKYGYAYKNTKGALKHQCKRCKQTHDVYSNISVLEAFHRSLSNSIPYASCPNPDCKNHYVNLFEYYYGDHRDRLEKLYRVHQSDTRKQTFRAKCRSCNSVFRLSGPLRIHASKQRFWKREVTEILKAAVNHSGPSHVMDQMEVHGDFYYARLRTAANAILKYNNFHLTNLMKASCAPEHMQIYTDCIVCSIKMHRKDQRSFAMKIIVSTCYQDGRQLILAFHPLFDQEIPDDDVMENDDEQPLPEKRYQFLKHPLNREKGEPLPPIGVEGCLVGEFYAYLSHFLVLRKLLVRVPSLHFYMDGEASLYNAGLNAFADRIKAGSCDIVVRKMDKDNKGNQSKSPEELNRKFHRKLSEVKQAYRKAYPNSETPKLPALRRFALNAQMKQVNEAIEQNSVKNNNGELFPVPLSSIYTKATKRANSSGEAFWITNEVTNKYNKKVYFLWLTRKPELSNTEYELNLYLNGTIFYIDSVFNAFRNRSSLASRPRSTATGHKSYNFNPEMPSTLIGDFTINVAYWNFFQKYRKRKDETIAYSHGLVRKPETPDISTIFQTQYTFDNAIRMRKWLGI